MFFCNKNVCSILNTAYQIFNVVTKNRCHLWRHTFKKSQKYLYNSKNLKKTFLQLRCSNVLLYLKYKQPLCKPEIEFKNLMGAKALATDHRGRSHCTLSESQSALLKSKCWQAKHIRTSSVECDTRPTIFAPDENTGDKRWIFVYFSL